MLHSHPLVSVVVPVYNMAEYLEATLTSILASTYEAFEVIIVDDGSTDDSAVIAQRFAAIHSQIRLLSQSNQGVCYARNAAIAVARGKYILPVDADNLLMPEFIAQAVKILEEQPNTLVVAPTIIRFGTRQGILRLPPFSLRRLAQRNLIDTCALYRRADWVRVGGYCTELQAREDWEFWIALLKDGGEVVVLPTVGLKYRCRKTSKRIADRQLDRQVILTLNRRHPAFFEQYLGGPLRRMRSWSKFINRLVRSVCSRKVGVADGYERLRYHIAALPATFEANPDLVFKNRNAIKRYYWGEEPFIVKSFQLPHLFNRFVYRFLRSTKAERSFLWAKRLRSIGVGSPEPIGYCITNGLFLLKSSYYVSRESLLRYTYRDVLVLPSHEQIAPLYAIAEATAKMHNAGWIHTDYSGGNILWDYDEAGRVCVELIDLNRMRQRKVSLSVGCSNFDRLEATPEVHRRLAQRYAEVRGLDVVACEHAIMQARATKIKQEGKSEEVFLEKGSV